MPVIAAASAPTAPSSAAQPAALLCSVSRATVLAIQQGTCTRLGEGELRILCVEQGEGTPLVLLTCGETFSYPLIDQPVLRSDERVFILPADAQKHFVVYIGDSVPGSLVAEFEAALRDATQLRNRDDEAGSIVRADQQGGALVVTASSTATSSFTATRVGESLSTAIVFTGKIASQALVAGAELAGRGVQWTSGALRSYLTPATGAGTPISAETMTHLQRAKIVSSVAVSVSAGLVVGAAATARSLAVALSAAVMSTEFGKNLAVQGQTETGQAVKQVAASSLVAFADVWDGLETAAKTFGTYARVGVHEVVEHRYGHESGALALQSLDIAQDVGQTALHMRNLGVGGMVRRTAAETAKEVILHGHGSSSGGSDSTALTQGHRPVSPASSGGETSALPVARVVQPQQGMLEYATPALLTDVGVGIPVGAPLGRMHVVASAPVAAGDGGRHTNNPFGGR